MTAELRQLIAALTARDRASFRTALAAITQAAKTVPTARIPDAHLAQREVAEGPSPQARHHWRV